MYHVSRNGRQYGPYTAEAIRAYLADGSLIPTDIACEEGGTVWRPLSELLPPGPPPPFNPLRAPTVHPGFTIPPLPPVPPVVLTPSSTPARRWTMPLLASLLVIAILATAWFFLLRPSPPVLLLEGSTTIGDALAPALLKDFLRSQGATAIEDVQPSDHASPHHDVRAKLPGDWRSTTFSIIANGSGNAFKALAAGRAEIGMASRPINNEEFASLISRGDLRSPASESIVALDGLAIIVNAGNPVNTLTRQQIAAIFSGKISDWSQVGGSPGSIHLFGRGSNSGTFDTFRAVVFAGDKSPFASSLQTLDNGDAMARAVASDPAGIGYVGLAQIASTKALEISDGPGTTPLLPSPFTIATEDYILSRRLFLYTLPAHSAFASQFIAYAAGPEGQKIVDQIGFVKQTPILEAVTIPASAPFAYRHAIDGLRRMSLDFRFKPSSFQLDNKALADLPRALAALSGSHAEVTVLGFADSRGTPGQNQYLSEQRAQIVSERLRAYGLQVSGLGLSSAMPVGDNATPEGRDKNRRVELWTR